MKLQLAILWVAGLLLGQFCPDVDAAMPGFGSLKSLISKEAQAPTEVEVADENGEAVAADNAALAALISPQGAQEALVIEFKQILTGIAFAQVQVLDAYGLNDQAEALKADADLISGDCTKKCLSKAVAGSQAANDAIANFDLQSAQFDAEARANLAKAIPALVISSYAFVKFVPKVNDWGASAMNEVKSAGMMGAITLKKKLDTGLFISTKTPGLIKDIVVTAQQLMAYSSENDIDIEGSDDFDFSLADLGANMVGSAGATAALGMVPGLGGFAQSAAGLASSGAQLGETLSEALNSEEAQEALLVEFKEILGGVAAAQSKVLDAYGLKDRAEALRADADLISGDCDKKCLDKVVAGSKAANEAIEQFDLEGAAFDAEGKARLAEAIPPLVISSYRFVKFVPKVKDWGVSATNEIKTAGMMGAITLKKKLETGFFILTKSPGLITDILSTAKKLMAYSKENKIEIEGSDNFDFTTTDMGGGAVSAAGATAVLGMVPGLGGIAQSVTSVAEAGNATGASLANAMSSESAQEALVIEFKEILSGVALAQAKVLEAYGLKDQAEALRADAGLISGDCDKKCLDKAVAGSKKANKEIASLDLESAELDAEGKAALAEAIPPLIINSYQFSKLVPKIKDWGTSAMNEVKAAGMMGAITVKKKLDTGLFISTKSPGLIKDILSTAKKLLTYSKENNIEIEGADDFEF